MSVRYMGKIYWTLLDVLYWTDESNIINCTAKGSIEWCRNECPGMIIDNKCIWHSSGKDIIQSQDIVSCINSVKVKDIYTNKELLVLPANFTTILAKLLGEENLPERPLGSISKDTLSLDMDD